MLPQAGMPAWLPTRCERCRRLVGLAALLSIAAVSRRCNKLLLSGTAKPNRQTWAAMLGSCSTATGLTAPCRAAKAATSPRAAATARVWQPQAPRDGPSCTPTGRRWQVVQAQHREEERGASAVGHDLGWSHVARDVRTRIAATAGGKRSLVDQLQAW